MMKKLKSLIATAPRVPTGPRGVRPFRPRVEPLEDRATPAVFTVTTADDAGAGSLRQAILDANAAPGPDGIVFAPALTGQTISLAATLPTISDPVAITGPGRDLLKVSGSNAVRVFNVNATGPVTLARLTIANGASPSLQGGGGILHAGGSLTLDDVAVTDNLGSFGGGGIGSGGNGSVLTVRSSLIARNRVAAGDGGGVIVESGVSASFAATDFIENLGSSGEDGAALYSNGKVVVAGSSFVGNRGPGPGFFGGAIRTNGDLTVTDTAFLRNTSGGRGGAVEVNNGQATFQNCTFVGNTAEGSAGGGAIHVTIGSVARIVNSTITGNTDLTQTPGGGIKNDGQATLINSVVANNDTRSGDSRDVRGAFEPGSVNNVFSFLDGDANLTNGAAGNRVFADVRLGPLADNGGRTQTRLPLPGSPLIDAGSDAAVPAAVAFDQRGVGFKRRVGAAVDVGAVEVQAPSPLVVGGAGDGRAVAFTPDAAGKYGAGADLPAVFGAVGAAVRTATADVDGDGFRDAVLVTGPGTPLRAAVVSGADNTTVLVAPFDPFGGDFAGGGYVAAADLDGDGKAEFVVSPDLGGGPRVSIFSRNSDGTVATRANFFGIDDPNFRGGARVALGDLNGDGTPEVVVAAGFGGGPRVAIFAGGSVLAGTPTRLIGDFFAFPGTDAQTLRNGTFVAAGDIDGDGKADLSFGGGPGGGPRVFALSGAKLLAGDVAGAQANPIANFFVANNSTDRGGVRLAVTDADRDGKADVVVGSGEGSPSKVRVYLGKNFAGAGEPAAFQDLDPFGGAVLLGGVFVG